MKTLARLSFTVPTNRVGEFAADYERRLAPILREHGLEPAGEPTRAAVDGMYSTLFEVDTPGEVLERRFALERDPQWDERRRQLGSGLGPDGGDGELPWSLHLYRAPAGPGRAATTGAGERRGAWHTFTAQDGLPDSIVWDIQRDREGDLWFGTGGGVVRFDGAVMIVFRCDDGLLNDSVEAIHQDREGAIWFGTRDGVSRYDGAEFTSFTTADGLGAGHVRCIFEDSHGCLWFGCRRGGLTRFDGQEMSTYTEGMAYAYRLRDHDEEWHTTRDGRAEYEGLPEGEYVFEVKAVDRDLNYSGSATVRLTVRPDPRVEAMNAALGGDGSSVDRSGRHRPAAAVVWGAGGGAGRIAVRADAAGAARGEGGRRYTHE